MRKKGYDYRLGMMTIFYLRDFNSAGAAKHRVLAIIEGLRVVNDGFKLIVLYGGHYHAAVDILDKTAERPWTAGPLGMHLIMHRYGADIKQAKAIKLSKARNTFCALVH